MKFTDEELSRILGAHANHQLDRCGTDWSYLGWCDNSPVGCINQAAFLISCPTDAYNKGVKVADWFDKYYRPSLSVDEFLARLRKLGVL